MINLSDITVEYTEVIPENRQMPEFYACGTAKVYATITKGDRVINVAVNGEMHLTIPYIVNGELDDTNADIIRYGDEMPFADDLQFLQFIKTISNSGFQVYRMNPWWEVYSDMDPEGGVYDTFYEAVDIAIGLMDEDDYWQPDYLDNAY